MFIELVNELWILLLLGLDLFRLLLYVVLVDVHEALQLLRIILLLHRELDGLNKLLNLSILSLRHILSLLLVVLKFLDRSLLLSHIFLHLTQALLLHAKELLEIVQQSSVPRYALRKLLERSQEPAKLVDRWWRLCFC